MVGIGATDEPPASSGAPAMRWRVAGLTVGLIAAAGGVIAFYSRPSAPAKVDVSAQTTDDCDEAPLVVNPGYVGAEACAACHSERVAEFKATAHYRTFRQPDAEVMPPGFAPGKGTYTAHVPGLRFEMTRRGDDFYQTSIRATADGEQRTTAHIDLVLGAGGKADEVYLTWHEDWLRELPIVWMFTGDGWAANGISRYGSGDFSRESTLRCLECHNTWFEHMPGTLNQYNRESFIQGVTCENCHGPGREHVTFHRAHPEVESGQRTINPARLTRERRLEVCTQCHGNATRHKGPAFSYRPGEPLEVSYKTLLAPRDTEDDHVANQIKYLRQSQCFQQSDDLTCSTCHNPHRSERSAAGSSNSCRNCHQPADCGEQPRLPADVRTKCIDCHMPPYIKINVNFDTEDDQYVPPIRRWDHRIAIHPRARREVMRDWLRGQDDPQSREEAERLTQSLVDDWLAEAEACRRDYRFLGAIAAMREAYRLNPAPAVRERLRAAVAVQAELDRKMADAFEDLSAQRYLQAAAALNEVLRVKPDHAKAHGKLGTAYAALGRTELAVQHWQEVGKCDPDDPYGHSMLGWQAYLDGRPEAALESYRLADEADPYSAPISYRWGLALVRLGRWEEAAERFRIALVIDPNDAGGHQGLAHVLRHQGRAGEALSHARRAARLTDFKNPDVLLTLTDVYIDLGRQIEANAAAERALAAAEGGAAELVPEIHRRISELRDENRLRRVRAVR